jgi:hypothetical protein
MGRRIGYHPVADESVFGNRCEVPTEWLGSYFDTLASRWGIQKFLMDGTTMGMS